MNDRLEQLPVSGKMSEDQIERFLDSVIGETEKRKRRLRSLRRRLGATFLVVVGLIWISTWSSVPVYLIWILRGIAIANFCFVVSIYREIRKTRVIVRTIDSVGLPFVFVDSKRKE